MSAQPERVIATAILALVRKAACPQCGMSMLVHPLGPDIKNPRRKSEDHILPKERGGLRIMYGDVRNTRIMCQNCNGLLASCFHCIGALACVRTVAAATRRPETTILHLWGTYRLVEWYRNVSDKRLEAEESMRATLARVNSECQAVTLGDILRQALPSITDNHLEVDT